MPWVIGHLEGAGGLNHIGKGFVLHRLKLTAIVAAAAPLSQRWKEMSGPMELAGPFLVEEAVVELVQSFHQVVVPWQSTEDQHLDVQLVEQPLEAPSQKPPLICPKTLRAKKPRDPSVTPPP